jgi:hypothetical protein
MRGLMITSHKTIDKFILITSNTSHNIGISLDNEMNIILGLSASTNWELDMYNVIEGSEIIGVDDV